ncbi:histidine kinase [Actinoplanes sp. NPDC049668]|uniref:sensor histidine kinase n=1 Tax=unclassified Actinoplanes TaxID=2626549 RepID=UPI0033B452C2
MRVARRASAIVVAVLCLLLVARTAYALSEGGPGYLFVLASFVLPFGYAVPATRGVWTRHRFWLLAAQAALTYVPFAVFGNHWVGGMSGLLGGLVLLTLAAPGSWLLFAALLVVECVLWMGVVGLPYAPAVHAVVWLCVAFVTTGLAFFGLARLSDVVRELHVARAEFARLAVARERLQATRRLRAALDERLRAVTEHGQAALRALADDRARARERMTEAGVLARQVLADVRAVTADPRPVETPARRGDAAVAPRLARTVLVVMLCAFFALDLAYLVFLDAPAIVRAGAVANGFAIMALQLRHSRPIRDGGRPRGWAWTLALQALLVYALVPAIGYPALIFLGFLAGSTLLLLPGRWAWATFAVVLAGFSAILVYENPSAAYLTYSAAIMAAIGLMVYGLSRLADLAVQLDALRGETARLAVHRERLRTARDVHDLLGQGLSVLELKIVLIDRLIDHDDARARGEIEEVVRICTTARDETRLVADGVQHLSLRTEIAVARSVLTSAGIDVRADLADGPLPAELDAVLATVLREAVTNILRHSSARHCVIETARTTPGMLRLSVSNDGVSDQPNREAPAGHGLTNLTARVEAAAGRLTSHRGDGRFRIVADLAEQ